VRWLAIAGACASAAWVQALGDPGRLRPETEWGDAPSGRLEEVLNTGAYGDLAWTVDAQPEHVLVAAKTGHEIIRRRLRRAADDVGVYIESTQALPGPPESTAFAIRLSGSSLPALGPVPSIEPPRVEVGREATHTLRHPRIAQAGLAQRCRPDGAGRMWCAIALADGRAVRVLDANDVARGDYAGRNYLDVAFAGDINRDGRFDLVLRWSSEGGAFCTGTDLYLSRWVGGRWRWPLVGADGFCE
jgi:hypothetical protein